MNPIRQSIRLVTGKSSHYTVRLSRCVAEVQAAQELRYKVFNLELKEGLAESHATGRDADEFDQVCDHLIVEHLPTGQVVGTYRLQTGESAARGLGYYSAQEFFFEPFERFRSQMVELGRACVEGQHRNLVVLGLLWRGIASYGRERGARYLVGCSSLTSQDPSAGASAYSQICRKGALAEQEWRTRPKPVYDCPLDQVSGEPVPIPKLLRAYLTVGAKICGPPALDTRFKTIDFLTMLDLKALAPATLERFLG